MNLPRTSEPNQARIWQTTGSVWPELDDLEPRRPAALPGVPPPPVLAVELQEQPHGLASWPSSRGACRASARDLGGHLADLGDSQRLAIAARAGRVRFRLSRRADGA